MTEQASASDQADDGPRAIARLNDQLRGAITSPGRNHVVMTVGIADLIGDVAVFRGFRKRAELLRTVRDYDRFDPGIDPYGEHDMGAFDFEGTACLWKIDYYNAGMTEGSDNPADALRTVRVLTIMRAEER